MSDDKKIDSLISLSIISIICIFISIILLINNKYKIINKEFISDNNAYFINLYNKIFLTIIFIFFLIINYNYYIEAINKNENITKYKLQLYSSILIAIGSIISLYVAYINKDVIIENPDI